MPERDTMQHENMLTISNIVLNALRMKKTMADSGETHGNEGVKDGEYPFNCTGCVRPGRIRFRRRSVRGLGSKSQSFPCSGYVGVSNELAFQGQRFTLCLLRLLSGLMNLSVNPLHGCMVPTCPDTKTQAVLAKVLALGHCESGDAEAFQGPSVARATVSAGAEQPHGLYVPSTYQGHRPYWKPRMPDVL